MLRGALPRPAAPRRGAGPRGRARQRRRRRNPRLLAAAPAPEARGGGARAVPQRRADPPDLRRRQGRLPRSRLLRRRHGGIPGRRGRHRGVPRGQHPPAGGAPHHRGNHRDRPRAGAVPDRRGGAAAHHRGPGAARALLRIPAQRRGRGPRLPALARHRRRVRRPHRPRHPARHRRPLRLLRRAAVRLAARETDRHRRGPPAGAAPRPPAPSPKCSITGVATVLPFHRAVLESPDFTSEDRPRHPHPLDRNRLRGHHLRRSRTYSTTAPDGERRTITVEVDGRRMAVGLPADLLDGWARSGGAPARGRVRGRRRPTAVLPPPTRASCAPAWPGPW